MQVSSSSYSTWGQAQNYASSSSSKTNALSEKLFSSLDSDSSGGVDESEFTTLLEELTSASSDDISSAFSNIDSDSDGSISQSEFQDAMQASMPPPPMMGGGMPPASGSSSESEDESSEDDIFAQFDTNGDGEVSQAELMAGLQAMKEEREKSFSSQQLFGSKQQLSDLVNSNADTTTTEVTKEESNDAISRDMLQKFMMAYIQNSVSFSATSNSMQSFSA